MILYTYTYTTDRQYHLFSSMPFLVKCYECGNLLGDLFEGFQSAKDGFLNTKKKYGDNDNLQPDDTRALGFILDEFQITRDCCRAHVLGYIDYLKCY